MTVSGGMRGKFNVNIVSKPKDLRQFDDWTQRLCREGQFLVP
jgi:hypothetical protein